MRPSRPVPGEDELACEDLIQEYEYHYQPVTALELARVREMALCDWRLRRAVDIERGLLSLALHDSAPMQQLVYGKDNIELDPAETLAYAFRYSLTGTPTLALLLRYQAQLQRSQERARKALKQLQAERQQQQAERDAYERKHPPVQGTRFTRAASRTERTQAHPGAATTPASRRNTKRTRAADSSRRQRSRATPERTQAHP